MANMEKFIKDTIKQAGQKLLKGYRADLEITSKDHRWEYVTEYDLEIEKFLTKEILEKYPDHAVYGEEKGMVGDSDKIWAIDPIDGTLAFVRHFAQFSVTMAFVDNGEIQMGAVYDPVHDELFFATKDSPAYLNDKEIKVNQTEDLKGSALAVMMETSKTDIKEKEHIYGVQGKTEMWSATVQSGALCGCYVASGRIEAFATKGLMPWDIAASALIAERAGATATDIQGSPYTWDSQSLVVANPALHKKFMKELNG